jgi:hypothetical protein
MRSALLFPASTFTSSGGFVEYPNERSYRNLRDEPTLEVRYGISWDAARLLARIEDLRDEDYPGKLTTIVGDESEKKIGIKCPLECHFPALRRS